MLSTILSKFIANATELCKVQGIPLAQPVAFAEQWGEQGGAPVIRVRPWKGTGAGPNFFGNADGTGPYGSSNPNNQMVRKVWTILDVQCWGRPDPTGNLLHNTDDTENLRQIVIVALNQAIPGDYRYVGEEWNHGNEANSYGRCLTIRFSIEQPIPDIQPNLAIAIPNSIQLTPEVN